MRPCRMKPHPRISASKRRRRPALTSAAESILPATSSSPASIAAWMRPRFTSLSFLANIVFLKPRLGSRRCNGIWPPSKPLMRTPDRAVWPLPPRPPVLPLPEPMPRPMRMRFLRAPALSAIWLSFMAVVLLLRFADHTHQVADLVDHAARRRGIRQVLDPADLVQAQPDQGFALIVATPQRARHLFDLDGLLFLSHCLDP